MSTDYLRYPVVRLDFAGIKASSYDQLFDKLLTKISNEYQRHSYALWVLEQMGEKVREHWRFDLHRGIWLVI
jgi:hypothetical protein